MKSLKERVSAAEEKLQSAHKRLDDVEEKKLSKHEFNGFVQVMDNFKTIFLEQFKNHDKSISENTIAITQLKTTFEDASKFLPILTKIIFYAGIIIITLLSFIATKLFHLW